jgi:FG-GAP-like repeat
VETFFAGNAVQELITGDFNGDGKIDIAAAGYTANASGPVGVLPGHGDGTFGTAIISAGVNSPFGIGAADFNGDGKLDLVISGTDFSNFTEQTYLLSGNGDGTFQAPVIVAPGDEALSVQDLNGDGKPDVIIWASPFIEVFLGNGNGTFTQKETYPNATIDGEFFVAVADFNGDGKLDITDGFTAIFGNGDGTFRDVPANFIGVPGNSSLSTVAAGDFNSDGKPDLAIGTGRANPSVYVLLGDGTGKYSVGHVYSVPSGLFSIQTADLNGDGKLDLLFNAGNGIAPGDIGVMLGNGDGTFEAEKNSSLGDNGKLQLADFNGDGVPDIVTWVGGQIAILIGAGDGTFGPPTTYFGGAETNSMDTGDFNDDGKADLVTCGSAGIGVLLGRGDGTLQPAYFPDPPPPPPSGPVASPPTSACSLLAAGDFNNDGVTDLIVNQFQTGSTLLGNGDGTFTTITNDNALSAGGVVADINGDGNLDLVGDDGLTVTFGNGDGTFSGGTNFKVPWISTRIWEDPSNEDAEFQGPAVFAVSQFRGSGLPGVAMIVQGSPGGEISLPNPLAAPAPDFALSTTFPALLAPGGQTTLTVGSKAIGAFNGDVALSCGGLPDGVTCSFATGTIASGSGHTTLTISAASSAALGRYPFTLTGTSGTKEHDRAISVTVATAAGATNASLLPALLNYSSHPVGSSGNALTTTLTNGGGVSLQISSVSIAGANGADFSISSNSCGTSVPAYASCVISVGFAPTASGTRSAMLIVKDNATGGAQVASLSAAGQDFTIAAGSGGNSATVAAGKAATYPITVGGSSGFSGNVVLTCSGAPTGAACTVSPSTVAVNGSTAATATVTVTTTARSAMIPPVVNRDDRRWPSIYGSPRVVASYAAALALSLLLLTVGGTLRRRRISWAPVAASVLLLAGMAMSGCGGGSSNSSTSGGTTPPPSGGSATGTPAGSYTITVTATTGSGANAVSHTTTLTLVVQ